MARFLVAGAFVGAAADTLSSCGADSDHLKINSITTDADADKGPRKGKPFTITIDGEFDEAHQHGVVAGDLALKALGVVDEQITFNQKYDFLPGLAQGATKVTIGPFTFPRAVPGEVSVIGKITLVNEKAEAVTCLDLNLIIPKILGEEEEDLEASSATCGDMSADHISNIQSETVDDVTTTTMDLDEVLDYVNLKVDIDVKAPVVPSISLKLAELPIALSPGLPAGQLKFVGYPSDSKSNGIDVTGTLTLEDKNAEEVTCVLFGDSTNAVSV
jgi:hypothetical protein